nr:hypothetical protein [Arthrospira sp. SH-MAG29]
MFSTVTTRRLSLKRKVTSWESYSNITYPHNSFPFDLKMWRFSEVGNWESFPKTESHQLGELLSYNLPT